MEEKVVSSAQLKALNDFIAPTFLGRNLKKPSVDDRVKYLAEHPDIPIKGSKNEKVIAALKEGLSEGDKTELEDKINLLLLSRFKEFVKLNPSIDDRLKYIFREDINLTSPKISNEILNALLTGLNDKEKEIVIEYLVRREKDRAMNKDPNTFMREPSLPKTAMMHHMRKKIEENPQLIQDFLNNPVEFVKKLEIPNHLKPLLREVIQSNLDSKTPLTGFSHSIIFSLASGPVTDYYNAKISEVKILLENAKKKKNNSEEVTKLERKLQEYLDKFDQVKETGYILTDANRMLTAKARQNDIGKQLVLRGANITDLDTYAQALDTSMVGLNENYNQGSIIKDTQNNRDHFRDNFTNQEVVKKIINEEMEFLDNSLKGTTEKLHNEKDKKTANELQAQANQTRAKLERIKKVHEKAQAFSPEAAQNPTTSPTTTPRSADQDLDEPKGTVRRKGSREHLGRQISDENMKALRSKIAQAEIVAGKQQSAEPPAEPAASSEKTPPPSPREIKIGTHRPPQPDQSPQSPPASPRGNIKIGMQRTQSEEKLTSKTDATSESIETSKGNRPPPPAYEAPGLPDEPPVKTTEKQKIGMHRSRSKETMAPTENRIQTTEQESSTELLNKTDELQSRVDQLQDRAVKLKEDAERRVERIQDLKLKVDERIVGRLENRINQLEKEKVKLAEMREKIAKRREELAQGTVTNPQAEHLLSHSKVQQEKVERASAAKAEAEADKISSRRSSTSRGSERR